MLRFAGILTGSALAIALIAATIGAPQFEPPAKQPDDSPAAATATALHEAPAREHVEPPAIDAPGATPAATDSDDAQLAAAQHQSVPQSPPVAAASNDWPQQVEHPPPAETANWYAFWSPFRSEIAANGFVDKLQESTGIDYRVVKVRTGVYEVAFAYTDDADIQAKLERISSATGLDMSGT